MPMWLPQRLHHMLRGQRSQYTGISACVYDVRKQEQTEHIPIYRTMFQRPPTCSDLS